jgi:5'-3' exonuclease
MDINAILDADSMVYASAVNSEDLEEAKVKLDAKINNSLNNLQDLGYDIVSLIVCNGSKGNFRHFIADNYKANRKDTERPPFLEQLHDYCKEDWQSMSGYGYETDDLVAKLWLQSQEAGENPVIVSIDKDYLQFPAKIYNYNTNELVELSELDALRNFYTQMIVGDTADNIKVCSGKGKAYAGKLLGPLTTKYQMVKAVYNVYKEHYKSKAREKYIQSYNLLKLRTNV